jgi:hypothetical protein
MIGASEGADDGILLGVAEEILEGEDIEGLLEGSTMAGVLLGDDRSFDFLDVLGALLDAFDDLDF